MGVTGTAMVFEAMSLGEVTRGEYHWSRRESTGAACVPVKG